MKRVKRVTAFISAILLASNNCYTYVMAADLANESIGKSENSNGEIYDQGDIFENPDDKNNQEKIELYIDDRVLGNIKVADKVYDGTKTATIDLSGTGYERPEEITLINMISGDDVFLTATAEFTSIHTGQRNAIIRFSLDGKDKDKYKLDEWLTNGMYMNAKITKAEIDIVPNADSVKYVYAGENVPESVGFEMLNSDIQVKATLAPDCNKNSKPGSYPYKIIYNENFNDYVLNIPSDYKFDIIEKSDISFKNLEYSDETLTECIGYTVSVKAPFGCLVSDSETGDFAESVDCRISTAFSSDYDDVNYYLKRTDNGAVHKITQTINVAKPQIQAGSCKIKGNLKEAELLDGKILTTNSGIQVEVIVKGNELAQNLSLILCNDTDEYISKNVSKERRNGVWYYTVLFDINDVEDGEFKEYKFVIKATDVFGKTSDSELSSDVDKVVIDKEMPQADETEISILYKNGVFNINETNFQKQSNGYFIAIGKVKDYGSGISKIEYKWDDEAYQEAHVENNYRTYGNSADNINRKYTAGRSFNYFESVACNKYHESDTDFSKYEPGKETEFQILVPYVESVSTDDNYHKLHIRLTDNAGNVKEFEGKTYLTDASGGIDELPPEITYIDVVHENQYRISNDLTLTDEQKELLNKEMEEDLKVNKLLRILPSGNYANKEIIFEIKAEDKTNSKYVSGLRQLFLRDGFKGADLDINNDVFDDKSNYLTLLQGIYTNQLVISASDGHHETQKAITELASECAGEVLSGIISDEFIIENVEPGVSFGIQKESHSEPQWIDQAQSGETLWMNNGVVVVKATDTHNTPELISGINSIYCSEEETPTNKVVDTSENTERFSSQEYTIEIKDIKDGLHTYYSIAEDNAGNKSKTGSITFNVDKIQPECEFKVNKSRWKDDKDEYWYHEDDDILVDILLTDERSGINTDSVVVEVNGTKVALTEEDIIPDENNAGCYIVKLVKDKHFKDIKLDDKQCYNIKAYASDIAENKLPENNLRVHVDLHTPWIDVVNVSLEDTDEKKNGILNIFDFGIFSNHSVKMEISAYDCARDMKMLDSDTKNYESKIKNVTVEFEDMSGNRIKDILKKDGDKYILSLPLLENNKAFRRRFTLTVEDNTGKKSSENYTVVARNSDGQEGSSLEIDKDNNTINIVLENNPPEVEIDTPIPHYKDIENNVTWFNAFDPRDIILSVKDSDSGLRDVSVLENGNEINKDDSSTPQEIINSENHTYIDNEGYDYVFKTNKKRYGNSDISENEVMSGKHEFVVDVTDNAGNTVKESYVYYIDSTKPEITNFEFSPVSVDGIGEDKEMSKEPETYLIEDLNYGLYFQNDFKVKIFAQDLSDSAGIESISYRLISYDDIEKPVILKEETLAISSEGPYIEITVPKGFKGRIVSWATDNVGNVSQAKTLVSSFISEDVPPGADIVYSAESKHKDASGNDLYSEDMSVTVTLTDEKSGLRDWKTVLVSEKNPQEVVVLGNIREENKKWNVGDVTSDGWTVLETQANLVTKISKTFNFNNDDNDIVLSVEATDNCGKTVMVESKKFTVDKTAPVIDIQCSEGYNGTLYYNQSTPASINIAVTERNFDEELIRTIIENSYNGNIPQISFYSDPADNSRHTAVVTFPEGDYTFDIEGSDRAGFEAVVNKPYDGRRRFYVDETSPVVKTNFDTFGQAGEDIYFNSSKKAVISVREHNFDFENIGLKVYRKDAGSAHNSDYFTDTTYSFVGYADWVQDSADRDLYTVEFETDMDAVYKIEIYPYDKAGNAPVFDSSRSDTEIYEIDTTMPEVKMKNGEFVSGKENEFEFLDIYSENSGDIVSPTVEFDDINYDYLEYTLVKFAPEYSNGKELDRIEAKSVTQKINEKKFTLTDFETDGIYAVEIIAFDKAGNKSVVNKNTYIRMKDNEVLAYIPDSNKKNKTGLYSFEYEDGKPISKRPDDFSDVEIFIISKNGNTPKIVLRDMNGDEKDTNLEPDVQNTDLYGATVYSYTLRSDFFIDNYQSDTDKELILTVKENENRIDLGNIHIDNIAPDAEVPEEFKSWHWYPGTEPREIVVTDINEILDYAQCKVYDNNEEIVFDYSEEEKTLRFTLSEGWHNVGIHLVDTAGNVYDVQEADNIYVGNMWSWIIAGSALLVGAGATVIVLKRKKR